MTRDDEPDGRPTTAISPDDLRQLVTHAKDTELDVRVAISAPTAIAEVASGGAVTTAEIVTVVTRADTATVIATPRREIIGLQSAARRAPAPIPIRTAEILAAAAARTRAFRPSSQPGVPAALAIGTNRVPLGEMRTIHCAGCGPLELPATAGAMACPRCGRIPRAPLDRTAWQWLVVAIAITCAVALATALLR
jgi:hypothetical protein